MKKEVLIGTPTSSAGDQKIERILTQLRARQIAEIPAAVPTTPLKPNGAS